MRFLVDTHLLLWASGMSSRLPEQARQLLEDPSNEIYCSVASLWEIAIKSALRKPDFRVDLPEFRAALKTMRINELPVMGQHVEKIAALPSIHKDPFDRILIAQSMAEPLTLLTNDAILGKYWEGVMVMGA